METTTALLTPHALVVKEVVGPCDTLVSRTHRGRYHRSRGMEARPAQGPRVPCVPQVTNLCIQPGLPGRGPAVQPPGQRPGRVPLAGKGGYVTRRRYSEAHGGDHGATRCALLWFATFYKKTVKHRRWSLWSGSRFHGALGAKGKLLGHAGTPAGGARWSVPASSHSRLPLTCLLGWDRRGSA